MTTDLAKYQQFTEDDVAEAEAAGKEIQSSKFGGKFEVGDTQLRVLPAPINDSGWKTFTPVATHYIDPMPGVAQKIQFNCPNYHLKIECLCCKQAALLSGSRNPADRTLGKRISAKPAWIFNAINRDNETAGPKIYTFGIMAWKEASKLRGSKAGGDFTNPTKAGFDIIVNRVGTGQTDTQYAVWAERTSRALHDDPTVMADWLASQFDLSAEIDCEVPMDLIEAWGAVRTAARQPATRASAVSDARSSVARSAQLAKRPPAAPAEAEEVVETEGETVAETDPDDPANW